MREDDDFRHYVPLLRRIIILVAVIIAVPVILWTITVFVRTYVGPPHMPTFHQLASTASINAPSPRSGSEAAAQSSTDGSGPVVEANATDARDGAAPKGPMLADRSADADASSPGAQRAGDPAGVFPPSPLTAPDGNGTATSAQQSAGEAPATGSRDAHRRQCALECADAAAATGRRRRGRAYRSNRQQPDRVYSESLSLSVANGVGASPPNETNRSLIAAAFGPVICCLLGASDPLAEGWLSCLSGYHV
jgi:hypothetical protein